jgi:malate permease and related proteins
MDIAISILSVYVFILLGFLSKKMLKEELQEKSLVILSIYFLQPMLSFWGLSSQKIDASLFQIPFIYIFICFITIFISFLIAFVFFKDNKDRSIITISSSIGNTGNLGIPIGIALFGHQSIIYTSLINVANIFIVYTVGVFFYSRGSFSIKESFKNIFKLPLIWFAMLALVLNFNNITIHPSIYSALQMGAYAAMVLQLLVFGMYLYNVKLRELNYKLILHVGILKFIIIPILALFIIKHFHLSILGANAIMLELLVPLAVTNVNLSSLYNCKPVEVTSLVFLSSLVFIPYLLTLSFFYFTLG